MAEVSQVAEAKGDYVVTDSTMSEVKATTQTLVNTFDEATDIVDFFNKQDEVKRMKKEIKRTVLDQSFGEPSLVKVVQERFMELGKTKFGK
jgi:type I restriction enzyme R subunit